MANYEVIVGNIGKVYEGGVYQSALDEFTVYKNRSINGIGKASNEPVTLLKDGEIIDEYQPDRCDHCQGPLESRIAVGYAIYCSQRCAEAEEEPKWTSDDHRASFAQGWLLVTHDGRDEIQRLDAAGVFASDDAARSFVVKQAANGVALATKALLLLTNPLMEITDEVGNVDLCEVEPPPSTRVIRIIRRVKEHSVLQDAIVEAIAAFYSTTAEAVVNDIANTLHAQDELDSFCKSMRRAGY